MTAQTDIVDRLRAGVGLAVGPWPEAIHEAVDEIERLRAENAELEAALDSHHADVGSNIWRYWRDIARDHVARKQAAEAEIELLRAETRRLSLEVLALIDKEAE